MDPFKLRLFNLFVHDNPFFTQTLIAGTDMKLISCYMVKIQVVSSLGRVSSFRGTSPLLYKQTIVKLFTFEYEASLQIKDQGTRCLKDLITQILVNLLSFIEELIFTMI